MPRDLQEFTASLPIGAALPELRAALDKAGAAVLEAPPGAGKTTLCRWRYSMPPGSRARRS